MTSNSCSARHICSFVPPYLLKAIADSGDLEADVKEHASTTFAQALTLGGNRSTGRAVQRGLERGSAPSGFVPGFLLRTLAGSGEGDDAQTVLDAKDATSGQTKAATLKVKREVDDAKHTTDPDALPGTLLLAEGPGAATANVTKDAHDCYDNLGRVYEFYAKVFGRDSIDDKGLPLIGSIHFGTNYENAFWDGKQMVFGDGGKFIYNFVRSLDVVGHELTHGVTERTAGLVYHVQPGALNESISDCFGSMIRQYHSKETSDTADWLIGEDCLLPSVKGVALRSMKAPGTAYNDPRFGKDPQPDHMKNFFKSADTDEGDWGGVHYNSGIPNRAFYLAAVGLGGSSWEKAGPIWYSALTGSEINNKCTFKQFADITTSVAASLYGEAESKIVHDAWATVGVL